MELQLSAYAGKRICVAVSGGRDSMALLHYILKNADGFGIKLSALNCDHKIRGEESARDSAFVKSWCMEHSVPLIFFEREGGGDSEEQAREWRKSCFFNALKERVLPDGTLWRGADCIATAHHMNDNAETVLFNLARGSSISGLKGICDSSDGTIIRPLIACTREEIDSYIAENDIPYVEDRTNLTDDYTRNKLRHNVIPALENAVDGAVKSIFRLSRLAAENEDYFSRLIDNLNLVKKTPCGVCVAKYGERAVFKRAALKAVFLIDKDVKDYTSSDAENLFILQFSRKGARYEFLNFVAFNEESEIAICKKSDLNSDIAPIDFSEYFSGNSHIFGGQLLKIVQNDANLEVEEGQKTLKFDFAAIPPQAVIRRMKEGDRFRSFGGGEKSLGDWFTDKKIPVRIRKQIPLIANGRQILAVCGLEISDKVKITEKTQKTGLIIAADYAKFTNNF